MDNFKQMLFTQIEYVETEPELITIAEDLKTLTMFDSLTEEDYQNALDASIATLQVSFGESYSIESDEKIKPWFETYYKDLGVTRWDRYVDYLKKKKGFSPSVINAMKENLFKITNLLGDPNGKNFERKGLIVGDVQSGKTANYVGLMNLATDAKYKIIIVLTGTTNTLREQTQIRIEEGLGKNSNKNSKGVSALFNKDYKDFMAPVYLTSDIKDFTKSSKTNLGLSLEQTKVPVVIVTKKNTSALKNIYEWLVEYSQLKNHDHIDSSLLLIDDEADFASVNTKKEEESPTAINYRIRNILKLFTKSSYIGFTATPFANIFIDPQTNVEMYGQDLFPGDYIYILGESSEYLGVQQIFSKESKNNDMLIHLAPSKVETYLPLKHKKDTPFNTLPPSMIDAINLFFISNVIRDLRGDNTKHRSMLINISMYSNMHTVVKDVVMQQISEMQKEIRLYSRLPVNEALEFDTILSIKKSFEKEYSDLEQKYTFEEILRKMNNSVYQIKVGIVNKDHKEVDYLLNEEEGERVIVIGGFALARGLTLEGLVISYYWRNTVMYDSLLQMGRWFGYRTGYKDLVRIYMTSKVISDFKFIATATEELKSNLEVNSKRGLTPRDFGIKIRSGQTGLIITARNKMRTGISKTTSADFNHDIIETLAVEVSDKNLNTKNIEIIKNFIEKHKKSLLDNLNPIGTKNSHGLIDIDKIHVIQFLKDYTPVESSKFDSTLMINWLTENNISNLDKWDVSFINGRDGKGNFDYGNDIKGKSSKRTMIKGSENSGIYKSMNSRLGSPSDGKFGLSEKQYNIIKEKYDNKKISQKDYFDLDVNRKPMLLIYSVEPHDSESGDKVGDQVIPLISIGIPDLGRGKSKYVSYKVNKIYQQIDEEIEVEENG